MADVCRAKRRYLPYLPGPGPRPSNAEMAQLVALLEERDLIEVYIDDQGRQAYPLTEEGVRVGNMLAMVEGEDAEKLEALLADRSW